MKRYYSGFLKKIIDNKQELYLKINKLFIYISLGFSYKIKL